MLRRFFVLFVGLLLLSGCGDNKGSCSAPSTLQSFGSTADASDIPMDSTVPIDQQDTLRKDLARLGTLSLSTNAVDQCTVGIKDFAGTTLVQYLKTRVRFVIGESFDFKTPTVASTRDSSKNPYIYSSGLVDPSQLSEIVTVMTNVGAFLYLVGREKNKGYALNILNQQVLINSPRDGIIQIGAGMFTANQVKTSSRDSTVNSLLRLAVMMHEARHSDGHSEHAAFPHATCDSGVYKDKAACEDNTNGPYAVQATLTRKFIEACTDCSTEERDGMMRLQADYASRLLDTAQPQDDRPEGYW